MAGSFVRKRKPSAVCSHQASAGNLDAHQYRRTSKYEIPILAEKNRKNYSNDFKLRMVELASRPIARENCVNDNIIFK